MKTKLIFLLLMASLGCTAQKTTLYTIGDSTMANKSNPDKNPEHGWAQVLQQFFKDDVVIDNRALNGRSTRSFIAENRWKSVYESLKPGDYVLIQFGHNDQKEKDSVRYTNPNTAYRYNLIRFVEETRKKGATPILLSSIVRRNFNEFGVLIDTHGLYPLETRLVALEYKVPFIDLQYFTETVEQNLGPEKSKSLHLHFKAGENPFYPQGKDDDTHLSIKGATIIAKHVVEELKIVQPSLLKHIQ